jgi:hypothetical protein
VLKVRCIPFLALGQMDKRLILSGVQAFEKLSKGLVRMAKSADSFDSRMVAGLLRSAPDLMKNIQHVQSMYTNSDGSCEYGCEERTHADGLAQRS